MRVCIAMFSWLRLGLLRRNKRPTASHAIACTIRAHPSSIDRVQNHTRTGARIPDSSPRHACRPVSPISLTFLRGLQRRSQLCPSAVVPLVLSAPPPLSAPAIETSQQQCPPPSNVERYVRRQKDKSISRYPYGYASSGTLYILLRFLPSHPFPTLTTRYDSVLTASSDSRPAMPFTRDTPASLNLQNHAPSVHPAPEAPSHSRPVTPSSLHSWSSELDRDIIPPYQPGAPRTLVLCFDGTGDQFDLDVRAFSR